MPTAPSLRRRRLAAELRKLREQSGLGVTDVAKRLDWQASRISRIENRQSSISGPDLRKLLDLYEVEDQEYRAYLAEIARRLNERGWWQKYSGEIVGTGLADLISLEEGARTIRTYEQELMPGLLQTPEYAQAVFRVGWPLNTADQVKRKVEIRIERQQVLTRPDPPPPRFSAVLGEGALRRPVGGREVMLRQLEHLMQLPQDLANVTIQVLPFDTGVHPAMVGPFSMMTFPDPDDLGVVNLESAAGVLFLEEAAEIRIYDEIWSTLQARALSPDDSMTFLRSTSFGYRLGEGMKVTQPSERGMR
jgi:transcriptional regulator with XRE-family HTH domain